MNIDETNDEALSEEGNKVTAGTGDEYLEKAADELPDANKSVENTDAIIGDVHPTERSQTAQEETNAESQNQSDASKIAGENL
jgi:hypothetical protein